MIAPAILLFPLFPGIFFRCCSGVWVTTWVTHCTGWGIELGVDMIFFRSRFLCSYVHMYALFADQIGSPLVV
jgi:hypothetical protein